MDANQEWRTWLTDLLKRIHEALECAPAVPGSDAFAAIKHLDSSDGRGVSVLIVSGTSATNGEWMERVLRENMADVEERGRQATVYDPPPKSIQ